MDKKKIIYKAKPHKRQPRMYLNVNRFCSVCGNNKTSFKAINHVPWHRDINEEGKWTGKYLCNKCYHRRYTKKRKEEIELMRKKFIDEGNVKLQIIEKFDDAGKI